MQAKDIVIGETYAIRRDGQWVPFRATSVVTSRTGNGPGKTSTRIHGLVTFPGKDERNEASIQVADIDHTYQARLVIMKQQEADEQRRNDELEKLERLRARVVGALLTHGVTCRKGYERNPNPERWTRSIDIDDEALPALAKLLGLE